MSSDPSLWQERELSSGRSPLEVREGVQKEPALLGHSDGLVEVSRTSAASPSCETVAGDSDLG